MTAICTGSASPHETKIVKQLIECRVMKGQPVRLIGDKAYDRAPLGIVCMEMGSEMISPHKSNRKKPKTQDGRSLRRYQRRWKVERLFAWLQNHRRLNAQYEYHVDNFLALLQLATFMILVKNIYEMASR